MATTGQVIGALLDAVGWAAPADRALADGDTITFEPVTGDTSALAAITELLEAERGVFYIARDGVATFEDRNAVARRRVSAAVITDGAVRAEPGFDIERLINRVSVQRLDPTAEFDEDKEGTPQVATNLDSLRIYGLNDGGTIATPYLATDAQAAQLAKYLVNLKGDLRSPLTVEVSGPAAYATLGLDLQDRVTVQDDEAGTVGDYHIERIEHTVSEFGLYHAIRYTLSPRGFNGFVFSGDDDPQPGDADYGSEFDSTTDLFSY